MKLVVGLGNPGKEYENTRHNVGFIVLDNYLSDVNWSEKFNSLYYKKDDIIFVKPQTFINLSGDSVIKWVNYYNILPEDIFIIHDDLDLEIGNYRVKNNSSSGGHNGLKSIINNLGTQEFGRLKIGISNNQQIPADKYVLGKFTKVELELLENNFDKFNMIIENFINKGIIFTLNNQR